MRYRLRTLLILLAVGPPMMAILWFGCLRLRANYIKRQERAALMAQIGGIRSSIFEPLPAGIVEVTHDNQADSQPSGP